jgi:type II secretory ATPase GspE/PulE/Tfp pilus assembly ATPase PilB-like protein
VRTEFVWPTPEHLIEIQKSVVDESHRAVGRATLTLNDGKWQQGSLIRIDPDRLVVEFQPNRSGASVSFPFSDVKSLRLNDSLDLSSFELADQQHGLPENRSSIKQKFSVQFKSGASLAGETAGFAARDYGLFLFLIVNEKNVMRFFVPFLAIGSYEIDGERGNNIPASRDQLPPNLDIVELEKHGQFLSQTLNSVRSKNLGDEFVAPDLDLVGLTQIFVQVPGAGSDLNRPDADDLPLEFYPSDSEARKANPMTALLADDDPLLESIAEMGNIPFEEQALQFDEEWLRLQEQASEPSKEQPGKAVNHENSQSAAEQSEMLINELVQAFDMGKVKAEKQERTRTQKLDEYQQRQNIVTPQQVETALQEQKSRPQMRIGEALLQEHLITSQQLTLALRAQSRDRNLPLGDILVRMGVIDRDTIRRVLAQKLGIPFVNLRKFQFEPNVIKAVPGEFAREHMVMPLFQTDSRMVVALEDPLRTAGLPELVFLTKRKIDLVMASAEDLAFVIPQFYGAIGPSENIDELVSELGIGIDAEVDPFGADGITESDNTLVRLVNKIMLDAYEQGVSDIHIETMKGAKPTRVRFRKDGVMFHYSDIPANFRNALVSRIKIMSRLDISEKRRAQDGKISFEQFGPAKIELRVATIPTTGGLEDIVMRILAAPKAVPLDGIGLAPDVLTGLQTLVQKPHGLLFVCGPTGSGKTTTLHALLGHINTPDRKIWTAEDPIEITQEGLRQVQVQPKIDWTFAAVLRSFMRADPDVIMVGETRDPETAKTVIEASLTGHLVLSTMHTNSAAESVVRLLDLGLDPFNFADALVGVLAQRLARRLCMSCRRPHTESEEELDLLAHEYCFETDIDPASIVAEWRKRYGDKNGKVAINQAVGCPLCDQSGYKGRLGVHELLTANAAIKKQIHSKANVAEILRTAVQGGMRTLRQDGIEKILEGHTDWEQIKAV